MQVLGEAEKLGFDCADLTGTKETRRVAEVGRYQSGKAVAITTYSNLFNVNPIIQPSSLLVLTTRTEESISCPICGQSISEVTRIKKFIQKHLPFYARLLRTRISNHDPRIPIRVGRIAKLRQDPEIIAALRQYLDTQKTQLNIYFPWMKIRNHLHACLTFASVNEIAIRPVNPPTHTHKPFSESEQRIYMSARC